MLFSDPLSLRFLCFMPAQGAVREQTAEATDVPFVLRPLDLRLPDDLVVQCREGVHHMCHQDHWEELSLVLFVHEDRPVER